MTVVQPEDVGPVSRTHVGFDRPASQDPAFKVGDRVRVRNLHTKGHTRLTGYTRDRVGVVERHHGSFVFPDSMAHGKGECPQHLYGVRFAGTELFGVIGHERDSVHTDLWESYLKPFDGETR